MGYPSGQTSIEEIQAWDILVNYLVRKHSAIESTIKRYIYVDTEKQGTLFSTNEKPNEKVVLLCRRNKSDLVGSVIYSESTDLNEDFNLKKIEDFFEDSDFLSEKDYEPDHDDFREEKIIDNNAPCSDRIHGAILAYIYGYEYEFAKNTEEYIYHVNQEFKENNQLGLIKHNNIDQIEEVEPITIYPVENKNLVAFIKENTDTAKAFNVEVSDVLAIIDTEYFDANDYLGSDAKAYGFSLFPLYDLNGKRISTFGYATSQGENESQSLMIRNKNMILGTMQFNKGAKQDNLYIVTENISDADGLAKLIPTHKVYCSITVENTMRFIESISSKNNDAVVAVVFENIYNKAIKETDPKDTDKTIIGSSFDKLINELIKNPQASRSVVIIMPEFELGLEQFIENESLEFSVFNFNEYLNKLGLTETKKILIKQLGLAVDRRVKNQNELDYIISEYIEKKKWLKENYNIELIDIFGTTKLSEKKSGRIMSENRYIQTNPIIVDGYKVDYKKMFEDSSMNTLTDNEKKLYEQQGLLHAMAREDH